MGQRERDAARRALEPASAPKPRTGNRGAGRGERDARASGDSRDGEAGTRRGKASTGEPQTRATTAAGQQSSEDKDSINTGNRAGKQRRNLQDRDAGDKGGTRNNKRTKERGEAGPSRAGQLRAPRRAAQRTKERG